MSDKPSKPEAPSEGSSSSRRSRDEGASRRPRKGGGANPRRRGRELALQYLYAADLKRNEDLEGFDAFATASNVRGPAVAFARQLVEGTLAERERFDEIIVEAAKNWRLERMAAIDRNVLRLGCYELVREAEIPARVTINEMIELAKGYGAERSGQFVNGLLDRINRLYGKGDEPPRPPAKPRAD